MKTLPASRTGRQQVRSERRWRRAGPAWPNRLSAPLAAVCLVLAGTAGAEGARPEKGTIEAAVNRASAELAAAIGPGRPPVAVPDIGLLDGRVSLLGRYLAEELLTGLFARGVDVVERSRLEYALRELSLGLTDLMAPDTARELGRFVGARILVVGTLTDLGESMKLNLRLVDVETTRVLGAASVEFDKTSAAASLLGRNAPTVAPRPRPTRRAGPETSSWPRLPGIPGIDRGEPQFPVLGLLPQGPSGAGAA